MALSQSSTNLNAAFLVTVESLSKAPYTSSSSLYACDDSTPFKTTGNREVSQQALAVPQRNVPLLTKSTGEPVSAQRKADRESLVPFAPIPESLHRTGLGEEVLRILVGSSGTARPPETIPPNYRGHPSPPTSLPPVAAPFAPVTEEPMRQEREDPQVSAAVGGDQRPTNVQRPLASNWKPSFVRDYDRES
jgi:hypothetical protein